MNSRPVEQIQRAHDLLVPILLGDVPLPCDERTRAYIHAAADVLCWCLQHDHNDAFANNLKDIEASLLERGYQLNNHGN